jgi:hypothetical protein
MYSFHNSNRKELIFLSLLLQNIKILRCSQIIMAKFIVKIW